MYIIVQVEECGETTLLFVHDDGWGLFSECAESKDS